MGEEEVRSDLEELPFLQMQRREALVSLQEVN